MTRILGIDPGSRVTGYGIIDITGQRSVLVASGGLRVSGETLSHRLACIFRELSALVREYRPEEAAVERVFMHRNADSALKLGQARGAALCALVDTDCSVAEYTPTEIKQAVVGRGGAAKTQVQHMVRALLGMPRPPQADEADALAVALCHGHLRATLARIPGARAGRGGRLR